MAETDGKIAVRVRFPDFEEMPAVFANHLTVQFLGEDFIVGFYAAMPPLHLGGAAPEALREIEIPARCVARLAIPRDRMEEIARALLESSSRVKSTVSRDATPAPSGEDR